MSASKYVRLQLVLRGFPNNRDSHVNILNESISNFQPNTARDMSGYV